MISGVIEGRIVHYVLREGESRCFAKETPHRPAILANVWNKDTGCANIVVFFDCNDVQDGQSVAQARTSVIYSEEAIPGTWHYPEKI